MGTLATSVLQTPHMLDMFQAQKVLRHVLKCACNKQVPTWPHGTISMDGVGLGCRPEQVNVDGMSAVLTYPRD